MFRRKRKQDDFPAEIEAHIQLEADRLRDRGLSEDDAEAAARRTFGNIAAVQERFYESRCWMWADHLRQDLRLSLRLLAKTPGWTAVAALTAALGIGATAAIFSIVHAVVLRPLPFPHPEQLYSVTELLGRVKQEISAAGDYFSIRESMRHQAFTDIAAYNRFGVNWSGGGAPRQLTAGLVTASFFPVLGVQPLQGRIFTSAEDQPGGNRVALLGYKLWQSEFAGDPAIVGQTIRLDRQPTVVIGIMPPGFSFPADAQLWLPLTLDETSERQRKKMLVVEMVARAAPATSLPLANAELERLTPIVAGEYPSQYSGNGFLDGMRIYARPLQASLTGSVRPALAAFSGAVALMLLIVCFNVANLMLARATARRREIAVRIALGAPGGRIVRQLIAESLAISVLGGVAGIGLGALALRIFSASGQLAMTNLPPVSIDSATAAFTVMVTILAGLVFGLAPAWGSRGFSVHEALQRESHRTSAGSGLRRMRQALVIAQLSLSLTLLIGAGLLAKSFLRLRSVDPGFRPESILTAATNLNGPGDETTQHQVDFYKQVIQKLEALPEAEGVAVADSIPLTGFHGSGTFRIENRAPAVRGQEPRGGYSVVSPGYFDLFGIPLLKGRLLTSQDAENAPLVAVVSEALARRYFLNEDPMGRRIAFNPGEPIWTTIVGVVGNIHQNGLERDVMPAIYQTFLQEQTPLLNRGALFVKTSGDTTPLIPTLEKLVASVDPDQPVFDVKTMEQRLDDSLGSRRFNAALIGTFAVIAAFLAMIGVYGVMSYLVSLRTSEIGIRLALGAQPRQIQTQILREGVALGLLGAVPGVAGAIAVSRYLTTLLYGVGALDPATFALSTALLVGAVLAACFLPGRRAARIDPVTALRHE